MQKILNFHTSIKNEKLSYFLLILIAFFIPFPRPIVPPLIILWFLISIFQFSYDNFTKKNHKILFFALISYFLYAGISILWSSNPINSSKELISILSFIIFPIGFVFSSDFNNKTQKNTLKSFIIGTLISFLIQFSIATYHAFILKAPFPIICVHCNTLLSFYFYTELSNFVHPSYASMFNLFSIVSILYLVLEEKENKKWFILVPFFLITIYMYSSKAGFLTLLLLSFIYLIYFIIKERKIKLGILGLGLFFIFSIFFYRSERVQMLLKERKINISKSENDHKTDNRIILWQTHFEIIKENFFFGTGIGDYNAEIIKKYEKNQFQDGLKNRLNAHNQYLYIFAILGIIGFLIFISILGISFYYSISEKNLIGFAFLFINSINFLFESMLERQHGISFFILFLSILFINNKKEEPKLNY